MIDQRLLQIMIISVSLLSSTTIFGFKDDDRKITVINATPYEVLVEHATTCLLPQRSLGGRTATPRNIPGYFQTPTKLYNTDNSSDGLYCRPRPELNKMMAPGSQVTLACERGIESLMFMKVTLGTVTKPYNPSKMDAYKIDTVYITAPPNKSFIKFVEFIQ